MKLNNVVQVAELGERSPLLTNATQRMTQIVVLMAKYNTTYTCSPSVSCHTKAYLTLNNFENDVDGSVPSECDNRYHSADTPAVALLTEWFNKKSWCLNNVTISANGRSMATMVVDECDLTMRCDSNHDRMY